jgi:hypothetical protein
VPYTPGPCELWCTPPRARLRCRSRCVLPRCPETKRLPSRLPESAARISQDFWGIARCGSLRWFWGTSWWGVAAHGHRVVANPLVSCGHCNACISGAQNLCDSWKLLGLGTTPGTFAEYVALPSAQVNEVPDSLASEQAILAEPLANIVHMLRIVAPPCFFRFAIVGAGTMGALLCSARYGLAHAM